MNLLLSSLMLFRSTVAPAHIDRIIDDPKSHIDPAIMHQEHQKSFCNHLWQELQCGYDALREQKNTQAFERFFNILNHTTDPQHKHLVNLNKAALFGFLICSEKLGRLDHFHHRFGKTAAALVQSSESDSQEFKIEESLPSFASEFSERTHLTTHDLLEIARSCPEDLAEQMANCLHDENQ